MQQKPGSNNLLEINFSQSLAPSQPQSGFVQGFSQFPQNFSTTTSSLQQVQPQSHQAASVITTSAAQAQAYVFQSDPPQRLRIKLQDQERGYYSAQLHRADPSDSNRVKGKDAVNFFLRSGLSKELLKKIWDLSSSNGEFLDRDEFYVALKLISYAQNNIDVSASSINQNIPSPLPQFNAKIEVEQKPPLNSAAPTSNQPQNNNNNNANPSLLSSAMGANTGNNNNFASTNSIGNFASTNSTQGASNSFEIDKSLLEKYEQYFANADTQKKGVLTGAEAKQIFTKSQLNQQVLMLIWSLVDRGQKGFLSKAEFIIAVHLIKLAKNNIEIPQKLPDSLLLFIKEYEALHPREIHTESQQQNLADFSSFSSTTQQKNEGNTAQTQINQQAINELAPQRKQSREDKYGVFNSNELKSDNINKQQATNAFNSVKNDSLPQESFFKEPTQMKNTQNKQFQQQPFDQQQLTGGFQQQQQSGLEKQVHDITQKVEETKSMLNETQNNTTHIFQNLRQFHENLLKDKQDELKFFQKLEDAYQTLNKKIFDENNYLQEEIKKIEDQKGQVLANLTKLGKEMNSNINRSSQLRKQIIQTTGQSINEIVNSANQTIENIVNMQNEINKSEMEQLQSLQPPIQEIQQNRKSSVTKQRRQSNFKALDDIQENKTISPKPQIQSDVTWRKEDNFSFRNSNNMDHNNNNNNTQNQQEQLQQPEKIQNNEFGQFQEPSDNSKKKENFEFQGFDVQFENKDFEQTNWADFQGFDNNFGVSQPDNNGKQNQGQANFNDFNWSIYSYNS